MGGRLLPARPGIREWTAAHFAFAGYPTGFEPEEIADRAALRAELGWGHDATMELTAAGRPFLFFPLPEEIAAALREELAREPDVEPIAPAAATRAATAIAELL